MEAQAIPEQVSCLKFCIPPTVYSVPQAPIGHTYVPLNQKRFSATYNCNFSAYPMLGEVINSTSFTSAVSSANFVIKSPYFKYLFVINCLLAVFAISVINFLTSLLTLDIISMLIYLTFIVLCPFGCRKGAAQYIERMEKYRKVMQKAMDQQNRTVFAGSGMIVDAGEKCLWLDFHSGSYVPPAVQPGYIQNPQSYFPGNQINL